MKNFFAQGHFISLCHHTNNVCTHYNLKKYLPICLCPLKHKLGKVQFHNLKVHVTILNIEDISFSNPSISIQFIFVQPIKLDENTKYKNFIPSKSLNKSPLIYQFELGISVKYPMNVFIFWQLTTKKFRFAKRPNGHNTFHILNLHINKRNNKNLFLLGFLTLDWLERDNSLGN